MTVVKKQILKWLNLDYEGEDLTIYQEILATDNLKLLMGHCRFMVALLLALLGVLQISGRSGQQIVLIFAVTISLMVLIYCLARTTLRKKQHLADRTGILCTLFIVTLHLAGIQYDIVEYPQRRSVLLVIIIVGCSALFDCLPKRYLGISLPLLVLMSVMVWQFDDKRLVAVEILNFVCATLVGISICWQKSNNRYGMMINHRQKEENLSALEEQIDIVRTISTVFSSVMQVCPATRRMEVIKTTEQGRAIIGNETNVDIIWERLLRDRIKEEYRENVRAFMNLEDVSERIGNRTYICCEFEDREGIWKRAALLPRNVDPDGTVRELILIIRTIDEEKKQELAYEDQIRQAMEEAIRASMAKTDFLRRMSHDIRTPINGIQGMIRIAEHYPEDRAKQAECRDKIWHASGYLLDLVNDVLDMSKLETGDMKIEREPFDVTQLLREMNAIVEAQTMERNISYRVESKPKEHTHLIGAQLQLRRILVNIAGNALKYNREGGYIRVSSREVEVKGDTVMYEFVCEDNGRGMSQEFQQRMFEPFSQENDTARTNYEGTGLGLAIVKKLVENLDGQISVTSERGKGSRFVITLPFEIDRNYKETEQVVSAEKNMAISGLQILLVEDNALNLEVAQFILEKSGAQVTIARNGQEALRIFCQAESGTFDVILMDIMMPVMDGFEATRNIRQSDHADAGTVPILAMTANAFEEDIQRCMEAGMNDHISKPIDEEKLLTVVAHAVAQKKISQNS